MSTEPTRDDAARLREQGLQVTAQRLAVLRAVHDAPHGTADELEQIVRARLGTISRQAVYDVLGTLTEKGLLRRIQPAGPGGVVRDCGRGHRDFGDRRHPGLAAGPPRQTGCRRTSAW